MWKGTLTEYAVRLDRRGENEIVNTVTLRTGLSLLGEGRIHKLLRWPYYLNLYKDLYLVRVI